MVRTGRKRKLEGGRRMSFYLDRKTIEYLEKLPNASLWIREKVEREQEQEQKAKGQVQNG